MGRLIGELLWQRADPGDPSLRTPLMEHIEDAQQRMGTEVTHALSIDALRDRAIFFWTLSDDHLIGFGALKALEPGHGEVKSMRILPGRLGQGFGQVLMSHLIDEAHALGWQWLSLETGANEHYRAARKLYEKAGFVLCPPFADYEEDGLSVYMTMEL